MEKEAKTPEDLVAGKFYTVDSWKAGERDNSYTGDVMKFIVRDGNFAVFEVHGCRYLGAKKTVEKRTLDLRRVNIVRLSQGYVDAIMGWPKREATPPQTLESAVNDLVKAAGPTRRINVDIVGMPLKKADIIGPEICELLNRHGYADSAVTISTGQ